MNASTRTLALTALLIAAATATSARAEGPVGSNGITLNSIQSPMGAAATGSWGPTGANGIALNSITLNGITLNGMGLNAKMTSIGYGGTNGITLNGLSINGIGQTIAVTSNGLGASSLEVVGPCDAQTPCVRPAAQEAKGDGATPRFQGRSARPLGDVGTAATK